MDWWMNPWAVAFMFAIAFIIILSEWFKAHRIIDEMKKKYEKELKIEKATHFWDVCALEDENKNYKKRLGINE